MFKILVLQTLYTLSDDQTEYQIRDRFSFMRFLGLAVHDPVPGAKTIWLFREQLTRAGAVERLFACFNAALREAGYLAMGGQIVDATVVQARRPRLTENEKETVKGGDVPEGWSNAKRAQMDTDGRWTIKRGRRRSPGEDEPQARVTAEIAVPVFGYKNRLGIDRRHGFIRTFTVTDAASHDGHQLGKLLDPHNTASSVWADAAYRAQANVALLARRGLVPQFQRPKPRGRPMPSNVRRGNATRARVRVAIEHVFAAQKYRFGLVVRSVGLARATTRLGLANLVTNMRRLVWFETRVARPEGRAPRPANAPPTPALTADDAHSLHHRSWLIPNSRSSRCPVAGARNQLCALFVTPGVDSLAYPDVTAARGCNLRAFQLPPLPF